MTDEQVAEFFEQWKDAGEDVRQAWLAEIEPSVQTADWEDVRALLRQVDADVVERLVAGAKWHKEAPQRNARKKRRKTQKSGISWQRELASYFRERAYPAKPQPVMITDLPREHFQREERLKLCGGKWQIWRDSDDRIVCLDDATGVTTSIAFATFERYLKEKPQAE